MNNNVELNSNNFLFATFVLGLKGTPYNTEVLLVNNEPNNTLDLIYSINDVTQTLKLPISVIKQISFKSIARMQSASRKPETNVMKSALLSAVVFGGHPLIQYAGSFAFNKFFDDMSNNYNKINFATSYEINIEAMINGGSQKFILNTDVNPEEFIKLINDKL